MKFIEKGEIVPLGVANHLLEIFAKFFVIHSVAESFGHNRFNVTKESMSNMLSPRNIEKPWKRDCFKPRSD